MVAVTTLLAIGLASLASAVPAPESYSAPPSYDPKPKCRQVNAFLSGLPPNHPLVIEQGYSPAAVNDALRADFKNILAAGYNIRFVLSGPEKGQDIIANRLKGTNWDGTGVGFGVRGSNYEVLTADFEDILATYRKDADEAVFFFNRSPNTTSEALQRRLPLPKGCPPGKDLGFEIYCDPSVCTAPY
ncbi:hypothetical protein DOTSEDRAFT_72280 [Dothistroma septosporum NZE10]|uniref:Uncharacterized protein n=1 Tax=Dothistroma septosporum (strain NZE10 / CBS 128990) TaxID=675120 RepID=N1PPC0_DOTSN|nr:hypothetical protein DOTSEDRAFT_72280 [Dothistroma septosporum NZE10]